MGRKKAKSSSSTQTIAALKEEVSNLREQMWSGGVTADPDMYLSPQGGGSLFFNRLSQGTRELNPLQQQRAIELAYLLYESNPLGKAIVETVRDFILGDSVNVKSVDSDEAERTAQQNVIDGFWDDSINLMDIKLQNKVMELGLFGEQCYPVEINPVDGHVRLGYIDPAAIQKILVDPRNVERQLAVITYARDTMGMPENKWYKIIGPDETAGSEWYGRLQGLSFYRSAAELQSRVGNSNVDPIDIGMPDVGQNASIGDKYVSWINSDGVLESHEVEGSCFYFTVNKVSNATRGRSDLLSLIDWVDAFDQLLFNEIDRGLLLKAFIWDVSLDGYSDQQITEYKKANPQPRPGSVRYHNKSVEWKAVTPDLKAADSAAAADLILSYISTGARLPKTWLNGMMDVNKATAQELGAPALARLSLRQKLVKYIITLIITFALDQAEIHGLVNKRPNVKGTKRPKPWQLHVSLPDLKQVNQIAVAQALNNIVVGLGLAVQQGQVDLEVAQEVVVMFIEQMGVEVNITALKERLKANPPPMMELGTNGVLKPTNMPTPDAKTNGTSGSPPTRIKAVSEPETVDDILERLSELQGAGG